MKRRSGFAEVIHRDAHAGRLRRGQGLGLADRETTPGRCPARLRQIKEIHARRKFNAQRWVNWQMGTVLAGGTEDLQ